MYQGGSPLLLLRLSGDVTRDGKKAVTANDATALTKLIRKFLIWEPTVPTSAKELAKILAPLCKMLRGDVIDVLRNTDSALFLWRATGA